MRGSHKKQYSNEVKDVTLKALVEINEGEPQEQS
jgi:hypothetical protein